eukprot:7465930-Alexandrium_andersonii.AAC.1
MPQFQQTPPAQQATSVSAGTAGRAPVPQAAAEVPAAASGGADAARAQSGWPALAACRRGQAWSTPAQQSQPRVVAAAEGIPPAVGAAQPPALAAPTEEGELSLIHI